MDFETVISNTIPSISDSNTKILGNITLLNHYLTETINKLNDIRNNITLNVNALASHNQQRQNLDQINLRNTDEQTDIINSHKEKMSSSYNEHGINCKLLFTDGTCFSSGVANIFGGAVFIHDSYPNISCIFTSEIKSTFEAEFAAMLLAVKEANELSLTDIIIVSDSQIAVSYANALLEAKSVYKLDSARSHIIFTPSQKISNSFLEHAKKLNSIQINFIHSHTTNRSIYHDGNSKADDLCRQAISLFKETLNDSSNEQEAQITSIPLTDIKILMKVSCGIKRYLPYHELAQQNDSQPQVSEQQINHQDTYENYGEPSEIEILH